MRLYKPSKKWIWIYFAAEKYFSGRETLAVVTIKIVQTGFFMHTEKLFRVVWKEADMGCQNQLLRTSKRSHSPNSTCVIGDAHHITNILSASSHSHSDFPQVWKELDSGLGRIFVFVALQSCITAHFPLNHYICNERRNVGGITIKLGPDLATEPKLKIMLACRMKLK